MKKPVAPDPSEFSLTVAELGSLRTPSDQLWNMLAPVVSRPFAIWAVTSSILCLHLLSRFSSIDTEDGSRSIGGWFLLGIQCIAGGAFLGLFATFFLFVAGGITLSVLSYVLDYWQSEFGSSKQKSAAKFRRAQSQYAVDLKSYEDEMLRQSESFWRSLGGVQLEVEVGHLFRRLGYGVQLTPTTGDGGVDLILMQGTKKTIVQCKAHASKVGIATAREIVASKHDFKADGAIIVATSGVTRPTLEYCRQRDIQIMTARDLAKALREQEKGASSELIGSNQQASAVPSRSRVLGNVKSEQEIPMPKRNKLSTSDDVARMAPCPCGSGKWFKKCHGAL